jgi:hypothetical protein
MNTQKTGEFRLIVEGNYATVQDARHALIDPFIEDFVETTGKFRLQNFEDIRVASGISLNDLEIALIEDGLFEISCRSSGQILNRARAEKLAETLRTQAMFDDVVIEPIQ